MLGCSRHAALVLGLWVSAPSCTLVADAGDLNRGCGPEEKPCNGTCVLRQNPEFGCGSASCQPCVLPNAQSICDGDDECAIAACVGETEDCDRDPSNGCEVNVGTDVEHCGGCNADACEVPGAYPACARGRCAIRKCLPGFKDCNRISDDGCEVDVRNEDANCGGCDMECASGTECLDGGCR